MSPEFSGECDWCRQLSDDLVEHKDWEEGLAGQLWDVCEACRVKEGITPNIKPPRHEVGLNFLLAGSLRMTTKYEVRQSVQSVKKRWQEVVAVELNERLGRRSFKQLSEEYPEEYFELVEVELVERCLHFTSKGS